jgi:hypothetical protein
LKDLAGPGRALLLLVALWLVLPALWKVLQALLPLIFMLLGVVIVAKIILGKVGKW